MIVCVALQAQGGSTKSEAAVMVVENVKLGTYPTGNGKEVFTPGPGRRRWAPHHHARFRVRVASLRGSVPAASKPDSLRIKL